MKKYIHFIIIGLLIPLAGISKKHIEIELNIKDYKGKVPHHCFISIEKYKQHSTSAARHVKYRSSFNNNTKSYNNGTVFLKLNKDAFQTTYVNIRVSYLNTFNKSYTIENVLLKDGDVFSVQLEFDDYTYNNTQRSFDMCVPVDKLIISPTTKKECLDIDILLSDTDKHPKNRMFLGFSIDSTCSLDNRSIVYSENEIKTDVLNIFLDSLEERLKAKFKTCNQVDTASISIWWNVDY